MRNRTWRLVLCAAALCATSAAPSHEARYDPANYKPPEFPFAENNLKVAFLPKARDWERMDIYVPKDATEARLPCVILIYGGGWGGKNAGFRTQMELLLKRGFVVALPDYVLGAQQPVPLTIWDGAAAVRFLRANAERYRIDPERIGAWGFSAGGWLAQYLCPSDSGTQFTISLHDTKGGKSNAVFPMLDPRPANAQCPVRLQGFATDWGAEKLGKETAVSQPWLTTDDPPLLTCHNDPQGQLPPGPQAYMAAGSVAEVAFLDVKNTHVPDGKTPAKDKEGREITWDQRNVLFFEEYVKAPKVATSPEFFPHGGPVPGPAEVRIGCVHPNAKIHYTLDGSAPVEASPVYQRPVAVQPGQTLRAIAIKPGLKPSRVTTAVFTQCAFAPPVITSAEQVYHAKTGQPFSTTFQARCEKPVTWHLAGKVAGPSTASGNAGRKEVPRWLSINPQTGVLSGTPPAPGVSVLLIAANATDDKKNVLYDAVCVIVQVTVSAGDDR